MVSWIQKFKCPYCKEKYDTEFEARDCAEDCAPAVEDPHCIDIMICDVCGRDYIMETDAVVCEQEHEEKNDLLWRKYLVKKNFDALKKAASLPGQKKLGPGYVI